MTVGRLTFTMSFDYEKSVPKDHKVKEVIEVPKWMDGIDKHAVFREELRDCSVGDPFGIVTERPLIKQRPYMQPFTK